MGHNTTPMSRDTTLMSRNTPMMSRELRCITTKLSIKLPGFTLLILKHVIEFSKQQLK
jgi:hypothetical protein